MSNVMPSIIVVIALFAWIYSVILFMFKTFTGRGKFNAQAARFWGIVVLLFFGIWIAGLLYA